jgi:hypothetical protein
MSAYKYLVVKLKNPVSGAHLNIFTDNSIWAQHSETSAFGSKKQIVVNLSTAKYTTDGDKKGKPLDTKNIRIIDFWGDRVTITVDDMYLTNNSDYTREQPDGIMTPSTLNTQPTTVYTLSGQAVRHARNRQQALQGLPPGIYIIDNKKVVVRF